MAIEREKHPTPTLDEVIADMDGADTFSKIDLNKVYHQLEFHPDSRGITHIYNSQRLYRYKRLCFGINSAAEIFHKKVAEVVQNIPIFRYFLKVATELAERTDSGSLFQRDGAQEWKALALVLVLTLGTDKLLLLFDFSEREGIDAASMEWR